MILSRSEPPVLLNGPPRDGPVGYLLGQAVHTANNYSLNGGTSPCHKQG
jgi:hypothetical protein